jgi:hypothetical protein
MNEIKIKERALSLDVWLRGLFTFLFILIFGTLYWITLGIAFFQFGSQLIVGEVNQRLLDFSESLTIYTFQVSEYLTFNTEEKPFPFSSWPKPHHKPPID